MDLEQILARLKEIQAEVGPEGPYHGRSDLDAEEMEAFEALIAEADELIEQRDAMIAQRDAVRDGAARLAALDLEPEDVTTDPPAPAPAAGRRTPVPGVTRTDDPWDISVVSRTFEPEELITRAEDAIERATIAGPDADERRERMQAMIDSPDTNDPDQIARMILITTSPAYKRAFSKVLRSGGVAYDLEPEEQEALGFARAQARAMGVDTDNAGGYLVPTDIEPAVTLSDGGTNNPIWNLGRRVNTTSDTYRVVTSPNAAWSWDGENVEVSDDTPTMANTDIPLYSANGFVPISIEATRSIGGIQMVASDVLQGGFNDLVGNALTVGTGSSQPTGIVTALTGHGTQEIAPATTDVYAVADVYAVQEGIASRHRRNAAWMMHNAIMNLTRQFATDDGHALLARLADGSPPQLLGKPTYENEDMDSSVTALAENYIAIFGDWRHYVIPVGIGTLVEVLPHVMGANGRPIGARGLYMKTRFGADSVLDTAFAMLNVT